MSAGLACAGLGLAACGGGPDAGDPDFQRHLAKPLPLNKVYTDSITFTGEDRADWKIFHVDQPGLLSVKVVFDNAGAARSCEIYLKDKYGAHVAREVQSNNPYTELVRRVEPGRFFVWVNAPDAKCASQYSMEARLDPD
jgi:hypothetical protein